MATSYRWIRKATVERVIDGDTVVLTFDLGFGVLLTGQHVRLVGSAKGLPRYFDAPEARGPLATPAGQEATAALRRLLPQGLAVTVETFKGQASDLYGRWLAAIWPMESLGFVVIGEDGPLAGQDCASVLVAGGLGLFR